VELKDKGWPTIKALLDAGVPCSLTTDHPVVGIEYLITSAIHAVRNGITEQQALTALTSDAAKHLGVDDRVGSLEAGKDADLVIWSGNPFDLRSEVEQVFIDGKSVKH
jgi:imidazolonepropionase-like amidohydrolase